MRWQFFQDTEQEFIAVSHLLIVHAELSIIFFLVGELALLFLLSGPKASGMRWPVNR